MADKDEGNDSSNIEILECREPHLEAKQDLEQLAQEIAEAAVEEERKLSRTPSPSPSPPPSPALSSPDHDPETREDEGKDDVHECEGNLTDLEMVETHENQRSSSPVDEASWVLVDSADDDSNETELPEQKFSIYRKFLARGDLRQKLTDIGLICDAPPQPPLPTSDNQRILGLENMVMSCSESIVICDLPWEGDVEEEAHQVTLKDCPDASIPTWKGSISGGTVCVEVDRQGGLLVAAVTVQHKDLLSALTSLRSLVTSAGLVSYADVDVPSLLARAA